MPDSSPSDKLPVSPDEKTFQELENNPQEMEKLSQELEKLLQEMPQEDSSTTENSPIAKIPQDSLPPTEEAPLPPAEEPSLKPQPAPAKAPTVAKVPRAVEAMLFVSPSCPRCQRLKQEGWVAKFQDKYAGQVRLTEYDLSIPQNEELLQNMMRKHHLTQVGYPTLFIAGNVVQGYPLNADPVVAKVLAKQGWKKSSAPQQQFIEITLEDSNTGNVKSKAPLKDRQSMQSALDRVKQSNQQTVKDIGSMFGADTQAQALAIVAKYEKTLQRTANTSDTYQNYLKAQQKILQEQEQLLNQLMRDNAYRMRNIRG